jgi:hypothetical protein
MILLKVQNTPFAKSQLLDATLSNESKYALGRTLISLVTTLSL